jgi:GNAT superfamily N-acetyltransferase
MYKLQKGDLYKASIIMGQAFNDYPIFSYIIPNEAYRKRNLGYICRFLLGLGFINGEIIAPSKNLEGVSIWFPSHRTYSSNIDAFRAGFLSLFLHFDTKTMSRFIEIGKIKRINREKIVKGPYYLCDMIGVNPHIQRQGIGRKMLEAKLEEFDKEKVPCYLETSKVENVDYYKKFGFTLIHRYKISEVNVLCLQREVNSEILM